MCAVNSKLGGSTPFHIPKKTPGAVCFKALSGKVYPRCLHFVKLYCMDHTLWNALTHDLCVFLLLSREKEKS